MREEEGGEEGRRELELELEMSKRPELVEAGTNVAVFVIVGLAVEEEEEEEEEEEFGRPLAPRYLTFPCFFRSKSAKEQTNPIEST